MAELFVKRMEAAKLISEYKMERGLPILDQSRENEVIATPTGISKSFITPEKLVIINAKGEVIDGEPGYKPSSEIKMHLRCYDKRSDVRSGTIRCSALKHQLAAAQRLHDGDGQPFFVGVVQAASARL